jgi:hypothetical protein
MNRAALQVLVLKYALSCVVSWHLPSTSYLNPGLFGQAAAIWRHTTAQINLPSICSDLTF